MQFYTKITTVGLAKLAAYLTGGSAITINEFAIGDANGSYYEPSLSQVALVHEVYRNSPTSKSTDPSNPNYMVISLTIPSALEAEFYGREAGLFDADGDLFAIAKIPLFHKVPASSGAATPIVIKLILDIQNSASVTVVVDESTVYATAEQLEALADAMVNLEHNNIAGRDVEGAHPASSISVVASDYLQSVDVNSALIELAQKIRSYGGIRQTVLDGLKDANGFPACVEPYGDIHIKSLYHFNGTNGATTVTDEVSGVTWTFVGNAQLSTSNPILGASSLLLNGTNSNVYCNLGAVSFGSNKWTVEAKFKPSVVNVNQCLFSITPSLGSSWANYLYINSTGKLALNLNSSASAWDIANGVAGTTTLTAGTVYSIAIEFTGTQYIVWLNGVAEITINSSTVIWNSQYIYLGYYCSTYPYWFNGLIDEFRLTIGANQYGTTYTPSATEFNYTTPSLQATVKASSTDPFVVTAADGFSSKGAVDYIAAFIADQNITLTDNSTNYLYAEYNKALATWSVGATIDAPTYQRNDPSELPCSSVNMRSLGSNIGNLISYGGIAAAFDGNSNQAYNASAAISGTTILSGYVGKDWGGITKKIGRVILKSPSDTDFSSAPGITITIKIQGSTDNFSSSVVDLYSITIPISVAGRVLDIQSGIDVSTAYRYHRAIITENSAWATSHIIGFSEVEFYEYNPTVTIFNTAKMMMYKYSSGAWSNSPRVYFAEAVTGASGITSITSYAYRGKYKSGWFSVAANAVYTKSHNIGVPDNKVELYGRLNSGYKSERIYPYYSGSTDFGADEAQDYKTCNIRTRSNILGICATSVGSSSSNSNVSGEYNLIMERSW